MGLINLNCELQFVIIHSYCSQGNRGAMQSATDCKELYLPKDIAAYVDHSCYLQMFNLSNLSPSVFNTLPLFIEAAQQADPCTHTHTHNLKPCKGNKYKTPQ